MAKNHYIGRKTAKAIIYSESERIAERAAIAIVFHGLVFGLILIHWLEK